MVDFEILGIQFGLRKVARKIVEEKELLKYDQLSKRADLKCIYNKERKFLYFAKDINDAKKAFEIEKQLTTKSNSEDKKQNLNTQLGKLFGYPDCCIQSFIRNKNLDFAINSFNNSTKLNFILNNLNPKRIISHFPCSYQCEESIKNAKILLNHVQNKKEIEEELKKDILVWNESSFMIFNNKFQNNEVNYKDIQTIGISKEFHDFLYEGNKIINTNSTFSIFKDDEEIFSYKKSSPITLFKFTDNQ